MAFGPQLAKVMVTFLVTAVAAGIYTEPLVLFPPGFFSTIFGFFFSFSVRICAFLSNYQSFYA